MNPIIAVAIRPGHLTFDNGIAFVDVASWIWFAAVVGFTIITVIRRVGHVVA